MGPCTKLFGYTTLLLIALCMLIVQSDHVQAQAQSQAQSKSQAQAKSIERVAVLDLAIKQG